MTNSFQHLFDPQAANYIRYRPGYPKELFQFLSTLTPEHKQAWDAGTGSGQAAVQLGKTFDKVLATDSSEAQISRAPAVENITFRVAPAEESSFTDQCCDLVTAANAVHWFDLDAFYKEVKRVLKPDGAIAVWGYGWLIGPEYMREALESFYEQVSPYWPAPTKYVQEKYRNLPFPFVEVQTPEITAEEIWSIERMLGFYSSWSASEIYRTTNGKSAVEDLAKDLANIAPDINSTHKIQLPLYMRVGHNC
ncbi:MAG: class I SAM-dependent methyltransferase [Candidatus Obscuribacterales bacterium]|nr:class I SAM-dependent methyltransferase [Candidatus Obscuribacterales bacterium]